MKEILADKAELCSFSQGGVILNGVKNPTYVVLSATKDLEFPSRCSGQALHFVQDRFASFAALEDRRFAPQNDREWCGSANFLEEFGVKWL